MVGSNDQVGSGASIPTIISYLTSRFLGSLKSKYVPSSRSSMETKFPRCQGLPSNNWNGTCSPTYKFASVTTLPQESGTCCTNPRKIPSPPFASFIARDLAISIGRLIADFHIAFETIFNCDPVSTIAVMGTPSHSICSLIRTPRVRVTNELATRGFPAFNLIESFSSPDNSFDTPSTSPTCN